MCKCCQTFFRTACYAKTFWNFVSSSFFSTHNSVLLSKWNTSASPFLFFLSLCTCCCVPLLPLFFLNLCFFLGGPEEHRWRGGSRDAQGHFRRPAEWGRVGKSYGGGWRGRHLPCEDAVCSLKQRLYRQAYSCTYSGLTLLEEPWRSKYLFLDWMFAAQLDYLCTLILDSAFMCVLLCISSVLTVCLVTGWTRSPLSPPTVTPSRWPTSGPSSSLRASPSLHQTPLTWCPLLNFSLQPHRKATRTTTPSRSEYHTHFCQSWGSDDMWVNHVWWVEIFVAFQIFFWQGRQSRRVL